MNSVRLPSGYRLETLRREHPRRSFASGEEQVDDWLRTKALQHQNKRLSITKVLLDETGALAGYFTLATAQVDFGDLPPELAKTLPRRLLPVAVLAWLGVSAKRQRQGLGRLLLAQALNDCHAAGEIFAFIAVILDCINEPAKAFYQKWQFQELPGQPYRLFLSADHLDALVRGT